MTIMLPCPFCGGVCDPEGWLSCEPDGSNKKTGPACDECGGATDTVERWNGWQSRHKATVVEECVEAAQGAFYRGKRAVAAAIRALVT